MMGGGQIRGEMFICFCHTRPGLDPGPSACQTNHTSRQATPVIHSWAQYIAPSTCIWLITSSKTERACDNRNTRLLDFVEYGRVRVNLK